DIVQEAMVERVAGFGERGFQIVKMHDQAGLHVRLAFDGDAGAEGMTVHPRIGMAGSRRRQPMGSLEEEFLIDTHSGSLEHDPEKWKPVFRKDHSQQNLEFAAPGQGLRLRLNEARAACGSGGSSAIW